CEFHLLQSKKEYAGDNCTHDECSLDIPIPAEGSTYCVSAKASFYGDLMFSAPSEDSCIYVPLKQTMRSQYIIIPCVAVVILIMVLIARCGYKKLRKGDIKQPESLGSVTRHLNTDSILEEKSETKYLSVISFMPSQSASAVDNSEVTSVEVDPVEETFTRVNFSEGASSVSLPEAPAEAEDVSVQQSSEEVSYDYEQKCKVKESYFISDCSQMDICSNSSGPEVSDTGIQQTVTPASCFKFSGYDKPHVPLDMLIDIGEEQPVIAYRPTN
ncbi:INGR1 protein, partial [Turnix velox]|nr:INGR1 protein [Turnix velox]